MWLDRDCSPGKLWECGKKLDFFLPHPADTVAQSPCWDAESPTPWMFRGPMEMGRADAAQCSYPQKARNRTFSSFLTEVFILQTILLMRQKPKLCHVGISSAPPPQGWILIQTIGLAPTHRKVSSTWFSASFLSCCGLCGPRFNPGWLLLRHPLFYSVSSQSPEHSLVCPWGWECCSGDQVSHWDMEIPTRLCKPVSLSFPSGHSLSRHLGKCRGSTDRALL